MNTDWIQQRKGRSGDHLHSPTLPSLVPVSCAKPQWWKSCNASPSREAMVSGNVLHALRDCIPDRPLPLFLLVLHHFCSHARDDCAVQEVVR